MRSLPAPLLQRALLWYADHPTASDGAELATRFADHPDGAVQEACRALRLAHGIEPAANRRAFTLRFESGVVERRA